MGWLTTDLLSRIRYRAGLPDSGDPNNTDAILLLVADDVTVERILPAIHAAREEYGLTSTDVALVAGRSDYRIPSRAAFGGLRHVGYVDSGGTYRELNFLDPEEIDLLSGLDPADALEYTVSGDVVRIPEPSSASGSLRMRYFRRPSVLVAASTGADEQPHAITSGVGGTTLTIGTHAFDNGDVADLVQAKPPFDVLAQDIALSGVTGTTVDIPAAVTGLAVGDYVCTAGETPVPQLPAELHAVLAIGCAAEVLRRGKDPQSAEREAEFERKLASIIGAMSPRVQADQRKIINHFSPLRHGRAVYQRWLR